MSFSPIATKPAQGTDLSTDAKEYLDEKSQLVLMFYGERGVSGWVFDIPTGENFTSKTNISKHYTENGSVINDHAINEPDEITLTGLIGELVYRKPQGVEGALNSMASRLGTVNAYLGPFTQGMTQKAAEMATQAAYVLNQAKSIAKRAGNIVDFFKGEEATLTLQQKAFFEIQALQKTHQIVWVLTPWNIHYNMLISAVTLSQDESSNDYTNFSVTLQEMRFTNIETTTFDEGNYKSAIDIQKPPVEDSGKVAGKTVPKYNTTAEAIAAELGVLPPP
jgi:hypothetical protein